MSSTKRVAASVYGTMFGGSATIINLNGPGTAVEDAPLERIEPLSPAATGVRLRRAGVPPSLAPSLPATPSSSEAARLVAAPPAKRPLPWIAFVLVFAGAAALTFAAVYLNALRSAPGIYTPQFLRVVLPPTGLGLRVETQGDRLLVNWDRRSPTVRSALDGILRIEDGEQRRALYLDTAQIAAGSILYKPASGDVTFRLEVQSEQGARTIESVRVLDSLKPPSHEEVLKPESNGAPPAAPIERDVSPGPPELERPARRHRSTAEPAEKPAPHAAPQHDPGSTPNHDLSDVAPLSTTPAALMTGARSFLALRTDPPVPVVQPSFEPKPTAATPDEVPDGKTISMAQPARPLRQVMPDMSALGISPVSGPTRVEVRVVVDNTGHVKSARLLSGGQKLNQSLARAALVAARQWRFEPALLRGRAIQSEHSIVFEFGAARPTGSSAFLFKH